MCNRTKAEVLARELCIINYIALKSMGFSTTTMPEYVERDWKLYLFRANRILKTIEKHKV